MKIRLAREKSKQFGRVINAESKHFLMSKITFIVMTKIHSTDEVSFFVGDEYHL